MPETDISTLTIEDFHAVEKERSRRDCSYFIGEYVKIEDRDNKDSVVIPFRLWDRQKHVLLTFLTERLIQVLKARQLGLTWLALAYAAWSMIFKAGFSVIALSKTEDDAFELVRRVVFIIQHLPQWLQPRFDYTKSSLIVYHDNGEPSTFQSFPASQNAGRSFTASLLLLDEWAFQQWAREIWTAAYPSVNRPTGGQVIGLSTIARGSLFEELWTEVNGFVKIFLGWDSDPRRTHDWYESTRKQLKDETLSEYPATVEEAFSIPGGAFFSDFRTKIHVKPRIETIPSWYERIRVLDYGLDMLACYWLYLDGEGYARVYREFCKPKLVISEAAYEILKLSGANVPATIDEWNLLTQQQKQAVAQTQTENITLTYAPPDLFAKSAQTGKPSNEVWLENGLLLIKTRNDFEQGCIATAEWLKPITRKDEQTGEEYTTARLTMDEDAAPQLVRSLLNIQKDKHNPKKYAKEPHELTHSVDAIRYYCTERVPSSMEPMEPKRSAPRNMEEMVSLQYMESMFTRRMKKAKQAHHA